MRLSQWLAVSAVTLGLAAGQTRGLSVGVNPPGVLTEADAVELQVGTDSWQTTQKDVWWDGSTVMVQIGATPSIWWDLFTTADVGQLMAGEYAYSVTINALPAMTGSFHVYLDTGAGDFNGDGTVNVQDINPFVMAMTDAAGWQGAYPDVAMELADLTGEGTIDVQDINPFVEMLAGGAASDPLGESLDYTGGGVVNVRDINPFVELLAGAGIPEPGAVIPEPGTVTVVLVGAMGMLRRRR
ncbi:MAG: hypothetical protein IT442_08415 [Phycisphaeraceae bacterium]|nr:hypothetical protein [Phycisphaeraceae bacterium]